MFFVRTKSNYRSFTYLWIYYYKNGLVLRTCPKPRRHLYFIKRRSVSPHTRLIILLVDLTGVEPVSKTSSPTLLHAYFIFISKLEVNKQTFLARVDKIVLTLPLNNLLSNEHPLLFNLMEYSGVIHKA